MSTHSQPAIIELISYISVPQHNARNIADVAEGLMKGGALLKAASTALGHEYEVLSRAESELIRELECEDSLTLFIDEFNCEWMDESMTHVQPIFDITYQTDESIGLELILASLPDIGIYFDPQSSEEMAGQRNYQRLYVSPEKWPFAGSEVIFQWHNGFALDEQAIDYLLENVFQGTNRKTMAGVLESGLIESTEVLCDWLLSNKANTHSTVGVASLPQAFDDSAH